MRAAAPLAVARRSGQQQYDQHHDRSDENRYDESAQKTQTTLAAAQPGEKAEYEIYNDAYRYGHYAIALLILLLSVTVRGRTTAPSGISRAGAAHAGTGRRRGWRGGCDRSGSNAQLLPLCFDEFAIVRRVEVEKRPT